MSLVHCLAHSVKVLIHPSHGVQRVLNLVNWAYICFEDGLPYRPVGFVNCEVWFQVRLIMWRVNEIYVPLTRFKTWFKTRWMCGIKPASGNKYVEWITRQLDSHLNENIPHAAVFHPCRSLQRPSSGRALNQSARGRLAKMSAVWRYFILESPQSSTATCNICKAVVPRGGRSFLKKNLPMFEWTCLTFLFWRVIHRAIVGTWWIKKQHRCAHVINAWEITY